jgi:hypothetical protein
VLEHMDVGFDPFIPDLRLLGCLGLDHELVHVATGSDVALRGRERRAKSIMVHDVCRPMCCICELVATFDGCGLRSSRILVIRDVC